MKKNTLILFLASLLCFSVGAVRSYPGSHTVVQPDGSELTLLGHGDEFSHHITTIDGYSVVLCEDGFYRYAVKKGPEVIPSDIISHNDMDRTPTESAYLKSLPKHISKPLTDTGVKLRGLHFRNDSFFSLEKNSPKKGIKTTFPSGEPRQYRGLVILVNFSDRKFSRGEKAHDLADAMMNARNRTSYIDPLLNYRIECTGSVRDYFEDNSAGLFVPEFDVVGPIEIPKSQYYINGTERTYELCAEVLATADGQIDFTRYDCDGDGEIDMVYVLYAGHSSTYQGNDERLVWPHAGHFADSGSELRLDGMKAGRFACSSELYGWESDPEHFLDGIGVIVHEFSHILGYKDHYDVSGYLNEDPGCWDVMASGNYNGFLNDTPCGYSSYERYAAGFIRPRTLTVKDEGETLQLHDLSSTDEAFRIVSMQDSTIFLLENRQPLKWDAELPGKGMLVWRIDSCDSHYWDRNALNVENRLHLKLVRANGATFSIFHEMDDTNYDPFPGTRNVTSVSNYTRESNLLSDLNYPSPLGIFGIAESDGVISFGVEADEEADYRPYSFSPLESYTARGVLIDDGEEREVEWTIRVKSGEETGTRPMIYDPVPDTRGICRSYPKYADGLCAPYLIGADRRSFTIEPARVAVLDNVGVWLVDFNDLEHGGSGAIRFDMDPYGNLSLSDPESVIGYCTLPKTSVVVDELSILERFSMVRNLKPEATGVSSLREIDMARHRRVYNLQGMPVDNPTKGEIYIVGGKKVIFR